MSGFVMCVMLDANPLKRKNLGVKTNMPRNGMDDLTKKANDLARKEIEKEDRKAVNKGGRPKGSGGGPNAVTKRQVMRARLMFEPLVKKAYREVEKILDDPDADPSVKLKASKEVFDRHYGTPVSISVVEKTISDERGSTLDDAAIRSADTESLQSALAALSRFLEREKDTIDVTPVTRD